MALYSAALFALTEGRAYSAAEYREWLGAAGLTPGAVVPTLIHCGVMVGERQFIPAGVNPAARPVLLWTCSAVRVTRRRCGGGFRSR